LGSLEVEPIPEMLPVFLKLDELQGHGTTSESLRRESRKKKK